MGDLDPTRLRAALFARAEADLAADRAALAAELSRLARKHVPAGGTLTPLRARRILDDYEALRRERYGARRGSERGTLYQLVAGLARVGWMAAVDFQARDALRRILPRGR